MRCDAMRCDVGRWVGSAERREAAKHFIHNIINLYRQLSGAAIHTLGEGGKKVWRDPHQLSLMSEESTKGEDSSNDADSPLRREFLELFSKLNIEKVEDEHPLRKVQLHVTKHGPGLDYKNNLHMEVTPISDSTMRLISSSSSGRSDTLSYFDRIRSGGINMYNNTKDELFAVSLIIFGTCILLPVLIYALRFSFSYLSTIVWGHDRREITTSSKVDVFTDTSQVKIAYNYLRRTSFVPENMHNLEELLGREIEAIRNELNKLVDNDVDDEIENLACEYEKLQTRVSNFECWLRSLLLLLRVEEIDAELNLRKAKLQMKLTETLKIEINNLMTDLRKVSPFRREDVERQAVDQLGTKLEKDERAQNIMMELMNQDEATKETGNRMNSSRGSSITLLPVWDKQELIFSLMNHVCVCKQVRTPDLKHLRDKNLHTATEVLEFLKEQEIFVRYTEINEQLQSCQQSLSSSSMYTSTSVVHSPPSHYPLSPRQTSPPSTPSTISSFDFDLGNSTNNKHTNMMTKSVSGSLDTEAVVENYERNRHCMSISSIFSMIADHDRHKEQCRINEKYEESKIIVRREIENKWEERWESRIKENQDHFERLRQKEREDLGITQNFHVIKSLQDECFSLNYIQSLLDRAIAVYNEECEKKKHGDNMMFCFTAVLVVFISLYLNNSMEGMTTRGENVCNFDSFFSIQSIYSLVYHLLSKKICASSGYSNCMISSRESSQISESASVYEYGYIPWTISATGSYMYLLETVFCAIEVMKTVLLPLVITTILKYLPFLKSKSDYVQLAMVFYFLVSDMVAALVRILGLHITVYLLLKLYPSTSWFGSARNRKIIVYFVYPCLLIFFSVIIMVHSETGLGICDAELYQRIYSIFVHCFVAK